jgi:hypothetical protein
MRRLVDVRVHRVDDGPSPGPDLSFHFEGERSTGGIIPLGFTGAQVAARLRGLAQVIERFQGEPANVDAPAPKSSFVTWTTPHMRAEHALALAAKHLEFGRFTEARTCMAEALRMQRDLLVCIDEAEAAASAIASAQVQAIAERLG